MTLYSDIHAGPGGRCYVNPYEGEAVQRPAGISVTLVVAATVLVALVSLLVVLKPLAGLALVGLVLGAFGTCLARKYRRRGPGGPI